MRTYRLLKLFCLLYILLISHQWYYYINQFIDCLNFEGHYTNHLLMIFGNCLILILLSSITYLFSRVILIVYQINKKYNKPGHSFFDVDSKYVKDALRYLFHIIWHFLLLFIIQLTTLMFLL
jgi:hypothetical protein